MSNNFHINQEVLCIKSHREGVVKEGQIYTIHGLRKSICSCDDVEINVGVRSNKEKNSTFCTSCGSTAIITNDKTWWLSESRFAPLEYDQQAIEELLKTEQTIKK